VKKAIIAVALIFIMATTAAAQTIYVTKQGYMATRTKSMLKKMISIASSGDTAALRSMVRLGRAVIMNGGNRVYIEDFSWGLVQFRRVGSTVTFWTIREALE